MAYAVIADWDAQMRVSRYNYVETEAEAAALVDKLRGVGDDALPPTKQAPNAYYVEMPPAPAGTALFQHRSRFWVADPANGNVSFDTAACRAWQSKVTGQGIDAEADRRIDKLFSPDDPGRAGRIKLELLARSAELQNKGRPAWTAAEKDEWDAGTALNDSARSLRTAAETLKASLAAMTPEEILTIEPGADLHWPE